MIDKELRKRLIAAGFAKYYGFSVCYVCASRNAGWQRGSLIVCTECAKEEIE